MPKSATTLYTCAQCDAQHPKWLGQCSTCGGWGTLTATAPAIGRTNATLSRVRAEDIPLLDAAATAHAPRIPTGISELDVVLGGGIVPASLLLLAGEPGIGKSTLVLHAAAAIATHGDVLYISGEETAAQIHGRAERVGIPTAHIRLLTTNDALAAAGAIRSVRPALAIVDSVQTLAVADLPLDAGGVTQIRAVTNVMLAAAKESDVPVMLIGHVTKDGAVAGPKTLEHLVDQVAVLEGESTSDLRILRTTKNRYGPTDVVGVFTMSERGLIAAPDPSTAFRNGAVHSAPGSAVAPIVQGNRTLLVEIQALVTRSAFGQPQRRASGIDLTRIHVLLAVLAKHGGIALGTHDVHVATFGGFRIADPAADLAILFAIASAALDAPVPFDACIGEVGLDGSIRSVRGIDRRVKELVRIGCRALCVPDGTPLPPRAVGTTARTVHAIPGLLNATHVHQEDFASTT